MYVPTRMEANEFTELTAGQDRALSHLTSW